MEWPLVSVIIVNYNGAHYLPACLDSLRCQSYPAECFEVIVSDNGSRDDSLHLLKQEYPWVRCLENGSNLGFAQGNNVAIKLSQAQYVVLLNNDTAPEKDWLENLIMVAQAHPEAGMVTGHLHMYYDQLVLALQAETYAAENDSRALGLQIFGVDSSAPRGIVQFLEGCFGQETDPSGRYFRWSGERALIGVPVPSGDGSWKLKLHLAAPRPDNRVVPVRVVLGQETLAHWDLSGAEPQGFELSIPSSARKFARPLEQNTGSIIFRNGAGRDRGTFVRNYEVVYETDEGQYGEIEEVFAGCGASLLLRRSMLEDVGLFDDDFFMYYEDTDLSWRARLHGWKVLYAPGARVRHIHCGTSQEWSAQFVYITERNRLAMVFKNGAWSQVVRVWGGYILKVLRYGWSASLALARRRPGWRQLAGQVRIHLRVFLTLLKWIPALLKKRWYIQTTRKVLPRSLESWFAE